jgi:hypothetical protein
MNKIKCGYLAAKMAIWMVLGYSIFFAFMVLLLFLSRELWVSSLSDEWFKIWFVFIFAFGATYLIMKVGLPKVLRKEGLMVWRNNVLMASESSRIAVTFLWAYFWRVVLVGGVIKSFLNVLMPAGFQSVEWIVSLSSLYVAVYWMIRYQYGNTVISGAQLSESSPIVFDAADKGEALEDAKNVTSTMINGVALIAYLGIGLVQISAVYAFFKDVWGWWLMPIIGSIAGMVGAINVWGWAWYWSAILFFFPWVFMFIGGGIVSFNAWFWDFILQRKNGTDINT